MSTKHSAVTKERRSVRRIGQRRQLVIPKNILDDLGIKEGDFVELRRTGDRLVIQGKQVFGPEDTLTPEEAKVVRKGERQLKQGQSRSWETIKDDLDL